MAPPERTPQAAPLIACCNSSEHVVQLLADYLRLEGFRAVTHVAPSYAGAAPAVAFLTGAQPQVCLYAVSLPYAESWAIFQQVRAALPACAWVVMTTNKHALDALVGPTETLEIWGTPFDLDAVVGSVRRVLAGTAPHAGGCA